MKQQEMSERLKVFASAFISVMDNPSPKLSLQSFTGSSSAFAAATLAVCNDSQKGMPLVLAVTPGLPEADLLISDLEILEKEVNFRALEFPPSLECDPSSTAARLKVSAALDAYKIRPYPLVVVAPFVALGESVAQGSEITKAIVHLDLNKASAPFSELVEKLIASGYERAPEVVSPGQVSVRGGVLDVWSPDWDKPVRAEFFGDEIESLRVFDPASQISVRKIESAEISPISISQEEASTQKRCLTDMLPDGVTVLWLEHNSYNSNKYKVENAARVIWTGDPAPRGVPSVSFQTSPLPGFAEVDTRAARRPELLDEVRNRLRSYVSAAKKKGALVSEDDNLSGGFDVQGEKSLVVVTRSDRIFAHKSHNVVRRGAVAGVGERLTEDFDLEPGELVVHVDYGIGRYLGTTEIEVEGRKSEVFSVEYEGGSKLHIPVDHAHLLSRYVGIKGDNVKLHRLDGKRWTKEKTAVQAAVQDLAASLLETQARRSVAKGFEYDLNQPGVAEFEASFPYEETDDQLRAIEDVKHDMSSPKPMDRLLCGDAGYGKTEVAMRAAFIAAMNGKQVALLAPTTVLVEQHYETFLSRFDNTPIRIEVLSRIQTASSKQGTYARIKSGATDIVIGTHAILNSKVQFKDLGLIIIDEEQRFGVKDKERLKRMRMIADVLTMSATPIPRTLYMSMTGMRDLSLLRTPPRERVAVETKVVRDTDTTVRNAIERELARGGLVFYLHNRVATIENIASRVHALVPKARIEVAHGQMRPELLAEKMRRFSKGQSNVLVSTTIIESGVDITEANTILVDRADTFGISALYQLRGRVGRGARQGYAFFLLPESGAVDSDARERLNALQKHAGLGAGFNLSLRDLEIRGAGNLLGTEQSGHIAAIGFSLYCQLLQRTISRLKGEDVPKIVDVSLNIDFLDFSPGTKDGDISGACLPYDYVEEEAQRMDFHKRLAETNNLSQVKKLHKELADRYGKLPAAATRLVKLAEFRILCAEQGIRRLDVRNGKAVFYRDGEHDHAFVGKITGTTVDRKLASLAKILITNI